MNGALREVAADLKGRALLQSVAGGLVAGGMIVALSISFAALVFAGPLEASLPFGLGLALFGSTVVAGITGLRSGFRGVISGAQDNPTAVLAAAAAAVALTVSADELVPTVLALIVVASAASGLALYLVGRFRVGLVVRYLPFPVIGGFLAATGVLLLLGSAELLLPEGVADAGSFDSLALVLPGVAIGAGVHLIGRSGRSGLGVPALLAISVVVLRGSMALFGVGSDEAMRRGWLFGPFGETPSWSPGDLAMLADADWVAVGSEWLTIASLVLIVVISLLLNVTGIEHVTHSVADADREMRIAGGAAVLAAAGGGLPGYHYLSVTNASHAISGGRRASALVATATCAAVLWVGPGLLSLMPKAVMGGVLAALGADYVITWLWEARTRMARLDHLFVITIGLTVVVAGFLTAIIVGIGIALALFAVRYSRVDIVHRTYSLDTVSSTVERSPEHRRALDTDGNRAIVIEVRGFVFFGTATRLFEHAADVIEAGDARFLVLDLAGMTGADSSFVAAHQRFQRATSARDLVLLLAAVPTRLESIVDVGLDGEAHTILRTETVDSAIQWCEEELLASAGMDPDPDSVGDFGEFLERILRNHTQADLVLGRTRIVSLVDGEALVRTGDDAAGLFILETGRLDAVLESGERTTRLRRMLPGAVIGEISLYRRGQASATVLSVGTSTVRHIAIDDLEEMERTDPAAAAAIHRLAAAVLSSRVLHAERNLRLT